MTNLFRDSMYQDIQDPSAKIDSLGEQVVSMDTKVGSPISSRNGYTYTSLPSWINEVDKRLFEDGINIKDRKYGAVGDGVSRPIYSSNPSALAYPTFKTLPDMQVKYPALTNTFLTSIGIDPATNAWQSLELDWCAIQQALKEGEWVNIPKGTYRINKVLDGYGARMRGYGRGQSKIVQYTNAEAVIMLGSVAYVSDLYFGHFGLPSAEVVPNGVGIDLSKYGLMDGAVLERLYIENNTAGIYLGDDATTHIYSATLRDIRVTRFNYAGVYLSGFGHTGSRLDNIYVVNWNNYAAQTKLTANYGFFFKGMNEGVFNQLNIEHGYYNKGTVISGSNLEINSIHYEGYEPNGSFPTMFAIDGLASRATVRNVSLVYSKIDTAKATDFSFATLGDNGVLDIDGFYEQNNTVVGTPTLRKFFGSGTIVEGAAIYARKFRMLANLFNSPDYFPITPIQPFLREYNYDRYYWSEGGKRIFVKSAIPTTGAYTAGDEVRNSNKAEVGTAGSKYVIFGWVRLTSGSAHVVGTDWLEMRMLTGN